MAIQGADRINGELEVGFDRLFERRWHLAELAGRVVMVAMVGGSLLGLFGAGPLSHATRIDATGTLALDFEPVARFGTPTQITLHLRNADGDTETVHLGRTFGEPFGLQSTLPAAVTQVARGDGVDLVFATVPNADAMMRLVVKPSGIGRIPIRVSVGERSLSVQQIVLP